jgi:hypothetical protein
MPDDLRQEGKFQWLTRFGFLTRGLLYIVIAWLVIANGRTEDLTGTMEYLSRGVGQGLMIFLVAGMSGYALWRLSDAAFGMESGGHGDKAWRHRIASAFSGSIYLFLAYKAFRILIGQNVQVGGVQHDTSIAIHLPAGMILLFGAAAVLAGAAVVQLWKAGTCSFLRHLDPAASRPFAKWVGRTGYAARGVIFLTIGWLLARAALHHDPAQSGGLEQALDALRGPLQFPVAAGLALFGAYSIVEARYRSIHPPPTERMKRAVEVKLPRG